MKLIKGDIFEGIRNDKSNKTIVLPHVVNNRNSMGSGFVVPLSKLWPETKEKYHSWFIRNSDPLGKILTVPVTLDTRTHVVIHMCSQTLGGKRPLFYNQLVHCMEKVADYIELDNRTPHKIFCPKFGSALAGGNWDFIEQLIQDIWIHRDIDVTVFEL